jgi:hypothetical protein
MVTVPVREGPLLAEAVITTVPLPVALADAVRNDELLTAVHPHVDAAVTSMFAVPPLLLILAVVDDSVTVHPTGASAPDWVKLTSAVPIAMLPERAAPVLAAML